MNFIENIKNYYKTGGMYIKLLYINIAVYIIINIFIEGLLQLSLLNWFSFNSDLLSNFIKPWSIISYMFIHAETTHILYNMLVLFFAGKMFEHYLGKRKVLSTYIIGGLSGALLFIITQNTLPLYVNTGNYTLLGSSASVMALFVGLASYKPNLEVSVFGLLNVKLYVLAFIYVGLDIINVDKLDGVAHFAHLGGAAWGYYMGSNLRKGKDVSEWFNNFIKSIKKIFIKKPKMKVSYSNKKSYSYKNDYEYNARKQKEQDRLNAILDKIKIGGYETLTKEEKEFLNNY